MAVLFNPIVMGVATVLSLVLAVVFTFNGAIVAAVFFYVCTAVNARGWYRRHKYGSPLDQAVER